MNEDEIKDAIGAQLALQQQPQIMRDMGGFGHNVDAPFGHNVHTHGITQPRVKRGRMVTTNGPWSNGHEEQCAIVTNVRGEGTAPGSLVNLHIFIDADQPMIVLDVPWYATRDAAVKALAASAEDGPPLSGAMPSACWFPERD